MILIIREITGEEHHIPLPPIERKMCHNTLVIPQKKKKELLTPFPRFDKIISYSRGE